MSWRPGMINMEPVKAAFDAGSEIIDRALALTDLTPVEGDPAGGWRYTSDWSRFQAEWTDDVRTGVGEALEPLGEVEEAFQPFQKKGGNVGYDRNLWKAGRHDPEALAALIEDFGTSTIDAPGELLEPDLYSWPEVMFATETTLGDGTQFLFPTPVTEQPNDALNVLHRTLWSFRATGQITVIVRDELGQEPRAQPDYIPRPDERFTVDFDVSSHHPTPSGWAGSQRFSFGWFYDVDGTAHELLATLEISAIGPIYPFGIVPPATAALGRRGNQWWALMDVTARLVFDPFACPTVWPVPIYDPSPPQPDQQPIGELSGSWLVALPAREYRSDWLFATGEMPYDVEREIAIPIVGQNVIVRRIFDPPAGGESTIDFAEWTVTAETRPATMRKIMVEGEWVWSEFVARARAELDAIDADFVELEKNARDTFRLFRHGSQTRGRGE